MKRACEPILVLLCLSLMAGLCGCSRNTVIASTASAIYLKRPEPPPPADRSELMTDHATWCYRTMASVDCYSQAQDVRPSRLVNVDPEKLRPLTAQEHEDEVAGVRSIVVSEAPPPPVPSYWERKFGLETFFNDAYDFVVPSWLVMPSWLWGAG